MNPLAFTVGSQVDGTLTEQVVRGIQALVHTGRLATGQRLPTLRDMSAELGVGMNTMRRAIAQLAAAGVLEVRRATGIQVRATATPRFQAQVLYISYAVPVPYYYAARNLAFWEALRARDIHVTAVYLIDREFRRGFPTVQHILATQPVTLAVLDSEDLAHASQLRKLLNARGVRFVEKWTRTPSPAAVDSLFLDIAPAYQKLARHCAKCGVNDVWFFSEMGEAWTHFRKAARSGGLRVHHSLTHPTPFKVTGEVAVEREGHSAITQLLKRGRIKRGQALLVTTDDYFARGALTALLEAGWRIPHDIQLATLINAGHTPVTGMPLTRIEMNPARDGEAMAQVVLRNLTPHKRRRKPLVVWPKFMAGKSTQPRARSR